MLITNRAYEVGQADSKPSLPKGRLLALDLGTKRIGAALCDELQITIRRLDAFPRQSWDKMLPRVKELIAAHEAQALILGYPLRLDGTAGDAAANVEITARRFAAQLNVPVILQDERLTSREAEEALRERGITNPAVIRSLVDSEAAAIILRDALNCASP